MFSRKSLWFGGLFAGTALAVTGCLLWSGVYDVGADAPHWPPVHALLTTVRDRSIESRAAKLVVPADLSDIARVRQGAGNYSAMCTDCHRAPGMADTELSRGLYPAPPNLSRLRVPPARAFWVIKHGIKSSAMPSWGAHMSDADIWDVVAFLQRQPDLDEQQYAALVLASAGHTHAAGAPAREAAHVDPAGAPPHHHEHDHEEKQK